VRRASKRQNGNTRQQAVGAVPVGPKRLVRCGAVHAMAGALSGIYRVGSILPHATDGVAATCQRNRHKSYGHNSGEGFHGSPQLCFRHRRNSMGVQMFPHSAGLSAQETAKARSILVRSSIPCAASWLNEHGALRIRYWLRAVNYAPLEPDAMFFAISLPGRGQLAPWTAPLEIIIDYEQQSLVARVNDGPQADVAGRLFERSIGQMVQEHHEANRYIQHNRCNGRNLHRFLGDDTKKGLATHNTSEPSVCVRWSAKPHSRRKLITSSDPCPVISA